MSRRNPRKSRSTWRRLSLESLESRAMLHGIGVLSGSVFFDSDGDGARDATEAIGVPGVVVRLLDANSVVIESTITDDNGEYRFEELEEGTYQISKRQTPALVDGIDSTSVAEATASNNLISNLVLADDDNLGDIDFGEQGLQAQFVSIAWFFGSAPPVNQMLRETIARGEELAGDATLAESIRAGEGDIPDDTNNAPIATGDVYSIDENAELAINEASGVLANDTDPDGDTLTATLVDQPTNGAVTFNADGSFTYTPDNDFSGDDSFTYRASDAEVTSNLATVEITVAGANQVPVANDDVFTVSENQVLSVNAASGVLDNDSDPDNDTLTATLVDQPSSGLVTLNADGSFTYTPFIGFSGTDSFTYRASDVEDATSNLATVVITVSGANQSPVAASDDYSVGENQVLTIDAASGVLENDTDPDGDSLTAVLVAPPANGIVSLAADGSFSYTPNQNFSGDDSFTYRADDGIDTSGIVTVSITVTPGLFDSVTTGSFEDSSLLGIRTDQVVGAPAITANHQSGDIDYTGYSNPPTYGDHSDTWLSPTGIFTTEQPDENLIHNLEHGHVWISYDPSLISGDDLAALRQLVLDGSPNSNGSGVGVLLTPRPGNDNMIALVSWGRLLTLDSYDAAAIRDFVETNRGHAPEGFILP